ncbi:MAG: DsrE family protein [Candidatus Thiodiazotropha sp. (ex Cardiolucina cf. quadrata)]|nr:DsrE family protein [Candidatus Thiodiazotropha sp. (ex Cardiolucina cf. quadrata)]
MTKKLILYLLLAFLLSMVSTTHAEYAASKVVYDVTSSDPLDLTNILDRVSLLQNLYGNNSFDSKIVIVIHEGTIPLFVKTSAKYSHLMQRAKSLTFGEVIEFRLCTTSAKLQGYAANDFHEFIAMVPMADAEIIMLQNNGYAYLR